MNEKNVFDQKQILEQWLTSYENNIKLISNGQANNDDPLSEQWVSYLRAKK